MRRLLPNMAMAMAASSLMRLLALDCRLDAVVPRYTTNTAPMTTKPIEMLIISSNNVRPLWRVLAM